MESADNDRGEIIRVRIKYLSAVRDRTGRKAEEIQLPEGSTLADVESWVRSRHSLSPREDGVMATLNGRGWLQFPEKTGKRLADGDVITLFPVLSGG
jgi:molybdopterin converting factor small subunit